MYDAYDLNDTIDFCLKRAGFATRRTANLVVVSLKSRDVSRIEVVAAMADNGYDDTQYVAQSNFGRGKRTVSVKAVY